MQFRILKRLTIIEAYEKVKELEQKYKENIESIPDKYADGQIGSEAFEDYAEWLAMIHALRAYGEGEDFDYYTEEYIDLPWNLLKKLSPKRLELLDSLTRIQVSSINLLASAIERDVKNVYTDLKILEQMNFVELVKEGRNIVPKLKVREVTFVIM